MVVLKFVKLTEVFQHYKRDADGLCCRLATPIIEENYCIPRDNLSFEDRTRFFRQSSLVIRRSDIHLGDIIGHGEFGGEFSFLFCCLLILSMTFCLDVLSGNYDGRCVAVKVLKRSGMVQSLLDEAKFMMSGICFLYLSQIFYIFIWD